jgi:hypothetical protein
MSGAGGAAPTSVAIFDQGLTQVLEASVTGLQPRRPYVQALAARSDGSGPLEPLASFNTNPAGAAIVNAAGPIRRIVQAGDAGERRYLVAAPATQDAAPVQVQIAPQAIAGRFCRPGARHAGSVSWPPASGACAKLPETSDQPVQPGYKARHDR